MRNNVMICAGLCMAMGTAGSASAQVTNLQSFKDAYEISCRVVAAETRDAESALLNGYTNSLQSLRRKAQQAGDLDALKAIVNELARFEKEGALPDAPPDVAVLRTLVDGYRSRIRLQEEQKASRILALTRDYDKALARLQLKLTQDGLIDEATAVQDERKRLAEKGKPQLRNIAAMARIRASSEFSDQYAAKTISDGSRSGEAGTEWGTKGQVDGAWVSLEWDQPKVIHRVVLYDRPGLTDWTQSVRIQLDGRFVATVDDLPNDGSPRAVELNKPMSARKMRIVLGKCFGLNPGLAEVEVIGE